MPSRAERQAVATDIWHCDPNAIICRDDHLLTLYKTGYRADFRRMNGHAFVECQLCTPRSYFLALFTTQPSPMVTCDAIDHASYIEWDRSGDATPPSPELLYRLRDPQGRSYNPHYRPPTTKGQ
jgi:hypothetical protein